MVRRLSQIGILSVTFVVLLVGYTNCSAPFGSAGGAGSPANLSSEGSICEATLRDAFNATYRPLFRDPQLCLGCHVDEGVSPYKFASANLDKSWSAFKVLDLNKIDSNAVSPSHAAPVTGPQNQEKFVAARNAYDQARASYENCLASDTPTPGGDEPDELNADLVMDEKNLPDLYFGDGRRVTVMWSLDAEALPVGARVAATFSVDISVDYVTEGEKKIPKGYTFSKPRIQMLTGEEELDVKGVTVQVNRKDLTGIEPLLSAEKIARGLGPMGQNGVELMNVIHDGDVKVPLASVSTADKIRFALVKATKRARTDNPAAPAAATIRANATFTRTPRFAITIGNDSAARRWCVTTSASRPTSTSAACPGFENSTFRGWWVARPTEFDLGFVGFAPTDNENVKFYVWVANADLRISEASGSGTIRYDIAPPAAVTYTGLAVNGTQIAEIQGLSNSNEEVRWCVKEASSMQDAQNPQGCTFRDEKPSFVGLRQMGTRYVGIHTRDLAGNVGPTPPVKSINNPYGRISFAQLTMDNDPRGVFKRSCFSCHGSGAAEAAKWNASSYADTITSENKPKILNRIENTSMPMPQAGLLPVRERMLINLWFTQTSTPVEQ